MYWETGNRKMGHRNTERTLRVLRTLVQYYVRECCTDNKETDKYKYGGVDNVAPIATSSDMHEHSTS